MRERAHNALLILRHAFIALKADTSAFEFIVGIEVSLGNWSYTFLTDGQRWQALQSSWVVSGYWLGLTLGRFTLARLAERLGMGNYSFILVCTLGIVVGVLVIWALPFAWASAFGFGFIGLSLGPIYPTTVALIPELVPERLVASAIGFLVSLSILGLALFPWLAGILAQVTSIVSLLPYTIGLTVLMLVFWWMLVRCIRGGGDSGGAV